MRLGTLDTELGHWRAHWVGGLIAQQGQRPATQGFATEDALMAALLSQEVDAATWDAAQLPVEAVPGTELAALCERGDIRDALVAPGLGALDQLPAGTRVGAAGALRQAQLAALRPDITFVALSGDTEAQLVALDRGEVGAVVVGYADLSRLGLTEAVTETLAPELCLPPIGQGGTAVVCRSDDEVSLSLLQATCDSFSSRREHAAEFLFRQAWQAQYPEPITACALASDRFLYLFTLGQASDGSLVKTRNSTHPGEIPRLVQETKANLRGLLHTTVATAKGIIRKE